MLKQTFLALALGCSAIAGAQNTFENQFTRPLGEVFDEVSKTFGVRLKYNVDTTGLVLPYADWRLRPYSVEETLNNICAPFDFRPVKQNDKYYKIKPYEYPRRTDGDGEKMIAYLSGLYADKASFEARKAVLKREVRERLQIDEALRQCVADAKPVLSKLRKYDGYTVQNFYLETLPGLYVCGSIYAPRQKGKHALIICPNGHFGDGRYNGAQQQRLGTLARMGAVCVDFDLFGWGESRLQVYSSGHHSSIAHTIQNMNAIRILDFMMERKDIDTERVGVNGGSGGGTQSVLLSVLDERYTACCPVVSLASHFDGGCPCESGMPIQRAGGGTCNAELAALFAPRPMCIVSDGKDWTHTVPTLEYPYLQRVYGFYNAAEMVSNVHLPLEGHDFKENKRQAVYDFFIRTFKLDSTKLDETKVTIEPHEAMFAFGKDAVRMPSNAIRSIAELQKFFPRVDLSAAIEKEKTLR